jgi:hypothetical protein
MSVCPNCGKEGPHYAPPGLGDPGFYICEPQDERSAALRKVRATEESVAFTSPETRALYEARLAEARAELAKLGEPERA